MFTWQNKVKKETTNTLWNGHFLRRSDFFSQSSFTSQLILPGTDMMSHWV